MFFQPGHAGFIWFKLVFQPGPQLSRSPILNRSQPLELEVNNYISAGNIHIFVGIALFVG